MGEDESMTTRPIKFLHAADIHLDSPLLGLARCGEDKAEEVRSATRKAFENMVSLAIRESVAFVLLAGDLYDGDWKDYHTGLFFARQMGRLRDASIRVFLVLGNHDAANQISSALRLPDNVHRFSDKKAETVLQEDLGVAVHGRSFSVRAVHEDLSASYPEPAHGMFNIGLLHTSLDGREGHDRYAPCSVAGLTARGYQYWALGHVHAREVVSRAPYMVFPGNTQGRHARETGPKGATLVTLDSGEVTGVEHRDLDVVRWHVVDVDLSECRDPQEAADRALAALESGSPLSSERTLAVRVRLVGKCPAHPALLAAPEHWVHELKSDALSRFGDRLWVEKVRFDTGPCSGDVPAVPEDDALAKILGGLGQSDHEEILLADLARSFGELANKLPPAMRTGPEPFDPISAETVRPLLAQARQLLRARLLSSGGRQ